MVMSQNNEEQLQRDLDTTEQKVFGARIRDLLYFNAPITIQNQPHLTDKLLFQVLECKLTIALIEDGLSDFKIEITRERDSIKVIVVHPSGYHHVEYYRDQPRIATHGNRAYIPGLILAQKVTDSVAGNDKMFDSPTRKAAGMISSFLRAEIEGLRK
ncbi:hypothetical protein AVT69_gp366 [Pseudomonas phage PhiPA3]|uniref:Uncharacterized protein 370 n=1 Tax=Pseudomonas phage PhiPA3 TaxID=998086 RepID=F8SJK2_BPPA3|nr:hypothetical protein AVT69_gp366 [Pseudomonas phage PhiPA3]AEH03793.1 hypothetical protein [Pseudomonas phage PhiPA3]